MANGGKRDLPVGTPTLKMVDYCPMVAPTKGRAGEDLPTDHTNNRKMGLREKLETPARQVVSTKKGGDENQVPYIMVKSSSNDPNS